MLTLSAAGPAVIGQVVLVLRPLCARQAAGVGWLIHGDVIETAIRGPEGSTAYGVRREACGVLRTAYCMLIGLLAMTSI